MSSEFVRTIKKTNLGGNKLTPNTDQKEPYYTNAQNDLLSDNEDVYVRNKDEYHCLTDGVKNISSVNDVAVVTSTTKNDVEINVKETVITASTSNIDILNDDTNEFFISVESYLVNSGGPYINITENKQDNINIYTVYIDYESLYNDIVDQLKADGYITDPESEE